MSDLVATLVNSCPSAVRNDDLYKPLTRGPESRVCGVGVNLSLLHDPPLYLPSSHYNYILAINSVESRSPASNAGFAEGDIVVAVNGVPLEYDRQVYYPEDVAALIRGPAESAVEIEVQRKGQNLRARLVREPVGVGPR